MAEKFCGLFSQRTGTIIILSFPVMLIIQGSILALFMSSSASSGSAPSRSNVWNAMLLFVILAISCTIGLLGVEQKNPSFLLPAIWMIIFLIISTVTALISYILNYFQLAHFQDTLDNNDQFLYFVVFTAMLIYAFCTVFDHLKDLKKSVNQKSYSDLPQSIV